MAEQDVDTLSTTTSQADQVREAWNNAGYDILIKPPVGADQKTLADLMDSRLVPMRDSSFEVYKTFKEMYGEDDDRTITTLIYANLYEDFTKIAISQLRDFDQEDPQPHSWMQYNAEACTALRENSRNASLQAKTLQGETLQEV